MAAPKKTTGQKQPQRVRILNGQKLVATLYDGQFGKYIAAKLNDDLLLQDNGRPLEFKNAGTLDWM